MGYRGINDKESISDQNKEPDYEQMRINLAIAEINKLSIPGLKVKETDEDREADALISIIKDSVGESIFEEVTASVIDKMIKIIKSDLSSFGVEFDHWFSEKTMIKNSKIDLALKELKSKNALFHKDGASWLKTTDYGDDKDRVVLRDDGRSTYFASDIAYHADKKERNEKTETLIRKRMWMKLGETEEEKETLSCAAACAPWPVPTVFTSHLSKYLSFILYDSSHTLQTYTIPPQLADA